MNNSFFHCFQTNPFLEGLFGKKGNYELSIKKIEINVLIVAMGDKKQRMKIKYVVKWKMKQGLSGLLFKYIQWKHSLHLVDQFILPTLWVDYLTIKKKLCIITYLQSENNVLSQNLV